MLNGTKPTWSTPVWLDEENFSRKNCAMPHEVIVGRKQFMNVANGNSNSNFASSTSQVCKQNMLVDLEIEAKMLTVVNCGQMGNLRK